MEVTVLIPDPEIELLAPFVELADPPAPTVVVYTIPVAAVNVPVKKPPPPPPDPLLTPGTELPPPPPPATDK
jgi:hypothetical protein